MTATFMVASRIFRIPLPDSHRVCMDPWEPEDHDHGPDDPPAAGRPEVLGRYAACMREHGIDLPGPDAIGPEPEVVELPFDPEGRAFLAAHAACAPILDEL